MTVNNQSSAQNSKILLKNLDRFRLSMGTEKGEKSLAKAMSISFERMGDFPDLGIYDDIFQGIVNSYQIPQKVSKDFKRDINVLAVLYLKLSQNSSLSGIYKDHMERLDRMAKYASLLKREFGNAEQNFYEFLDIANFFEEKDEDEPTVYEFTNSLCKNLGVVENLSANLKTSFLGKSWGIGVPGKRKNTALYCWVAGQFHLWTNQLGRTMQRDKNGLNGRKKFLHLLDDLMAPLHPELCSHNIDLGDIREHPISNEAISSALRAVRKDIKLRGNNDRQKTN